MRYLVLFAVFSVMAFSETVASPKPAAAGPGKQPSIYTCRCDGSSAGMSWGVWCVPGGGTCIAHPCEDCAE